MPVTSSPTTLRSANAFDIAMSNVADMYPTYRWQKYALVEGLEPSATRLKAERSDPLSYTSEDRAYCWRIHRLLRIYARVEAAGTILWAPAYSGWSVARTTATGQ